MLTSVRGQAIAGLLLLWSAGSSHAQVSTDTAAPAASAPAILGPISQDPLAPAPPMPAGPPIAQVLNPPIVTPTLAPQPACAPPWHVDPLGLWASLYPTRHACCNGGCAGGPEPCIPFEDRNGPLLIGDPLLDNPPATPGWIAGLEMAGVVPHRQDVLRNDVTLSNGATTNVALPNTPLGAQVMPTIVFGYRWGQGTGDVTVSYRVVAGAGTQFLGPGVLTPFAPTGAAMRSRLNFQVLDFDYGSYEPSLGPQWDMKWRIGIRATMQYSDNQADSPFMYQQTTNRYWGIGPHGGLDLRRWIGDTGLALYGRFDFSFPVGRTAQRYIDIGPGAEGESRLFQNNQVMSLGTQLGMAWMPNRCDRFRVVAGWLLEHWYDIGSVGVSAPVPRQQLNIQGGFVRVEWNY
jgi:hypothetical protein